MACWVCSFDTSPQVIMSVIFYMLSVFISLAFADEGIVDRVYREFGVTKDFSVSQAPDPKMYVCKRNKAFDETEREYLGRGDDYNEKEVYTYPDKMYISNHNYHSYDYNYTTTRGHKTANQPVDIYDGSFLIPIENSHNLILYYYNDPWGKCEEPTG